MANLTDEGMKRVEAALAAQPYRGYPAFADIKAVALAILETIAAVANNAADVPAPQGPPTPAPDETLAAASDAASEPAIPPATVPRPRGARAKAQTAAPQE